MMNIMRPPPTEHVRDIAEDLRMTIKAAWNKILTTDYFTLAQNLSDKIRTPVEKFHQTVLEANYNAQPRTLWSLISGKKRVLPDTTSLAVGNRMLGTSRFVGQRFLWAAVFAALSTKTLLVAAVAFGTAGTALFGLEYYRARKDCDDIITETNFAGQHVEGKRSDLCRLHQAQMKIINLGTSFKQASLESTSETIKSIVNSVHAERQRVRILSPGPYDTLSNTYDFSRPQVALVDHDGGAREKPVLKRRSVTEVAPATPVFRRVMRRGDAMKVAEHIANLNNALPKDLRRAVMRELRR